MRCKLILICCFFLNIILSQENKKVTDLKLLYSIGDSICKSSNKLIFCKTYNLYRLRDFDSSYVYSNKSLSKTNSKIEKDILNYIHGISAMNKGFKKKALKSFLEISEDKKFKNLKLLNLGWSYLNLKEYLKSINVYLEWESNNFSTDLKLKKFAYHNLGICYMHIKEYKKAEKYYDKEFNLIESTDTLPIIKAKTDLANVYYQQYLDDKAIPLFKEAYKLAKLFPDIEMKQETAKNMAVVEKNRKDYKKSVNYYTESITWKDSIFNRDRIWELTEKDKQLAVAQKQQEIALQEEQLKRQKTQRDALIIGVSGLLLFLGGLGFLYKKLQSQNRFITKQKEALNTANKTKDYLFSVVSHDLRSPINAIKCQHEQLKEHIVNNDLPAIAATNNKAIAVTESTSHLLNNVLHWSLEQSNQLLFSPQEIALRPIVQHVLFDYKMLVEANSINIATVLENALVNADKESVKIVLRNVLDNAVKYGGEEILVSTGISSENKAFIKVKDNGVGIPPEKLEKINSLTNLTIEKVDRSQGIGLGVVLCHTLIKKNNGMLTFSSEANKGTTVTIEFPNVEV